MLIEFTIEEFNTTSKPAMPTVLYSIEYDTLMQGIDAISLFDNRLERIFLPKGQVYSIQLTEWSDTDEITYADTITTPKTPETQAIVNSLAEELHLVDQSK